MKKVIIIKHFTSPLRIFALLGILIFIFSQTINAQWQNIRFKHLTREDGLSQSWAHSIIQDKYGFMWIGTEGGLNRYDGHSFRVYKNNFRDQYSISNDGILTLFENSSGDLWIGIEKV